MKGWKKAKSKNPYETYTWINSKKKKMIQVHYDIGFGKQRNTTVYDLSKRGLMGFKPIKTYYGKNTRDALKAAKKFMK